MKKSFVVLSARTYFAKDKAGNVTDRVMVAIRGAKEDELLYLSLKQVQAQGYQNPTAMIGSKVEATFYAKDEEMLNNTKCTVDGKIIKEFSIEFSQMDLLLIKAAAFGTKVSIN